MVNIHRTSGYYCEWPSNGLGILDSDPIASVIAHLKFIISVQQEIDLPHCKMVTFQIDGEVYTLIYWHGERLALDASKAGTASKGTWLVQSINDILQRNNQKS